MHKRKKVNWAKKIAIVVLIISLVVLAGSVILLNLGKISLPSPIIVLLLFGCIIGFFLSTFVIIMPDTKNNEVSKQILKFFRE